MTDEEIDTAAHGILYLILSTLMEEFPAVAKLAAHRRWQAVLDDLEKQTADALRNHLRSM